MLAHGFRLQGTLHIGHLQSSLEKILARHESLRTRIVIVDEVALQEVMEPAPFRLECVSIGGASNAEIEANARQVFADLSAKRVDLAVDALLRIKLLKLSDREHWLLLAAHRLIADCFSVDQLIPELWSLYESAMRGQHSSLPSAPPQYGAYAIRQQENHAQWVKRHEAYWAQRLAGAQNLQWPVDRNAARVSRGTLGRMRRLLDENLSAGLRELARRERTLLATVMLAAYVAALLRFCEQRDFVVPFFVAGRQSQQRAVIGYFSHILYLRVTISGTETFKQLLTHVSNELFRAFTHQDFGVIALQKPSLLEGTFFQWLTWQADDTPGMTHLAAPAGESLRVDRVNIVNFAEDVTAIPPGVVAVELSCFDTAEGIYASGVYRADLFMPQTIERFMDELTLVAEQFVQSPNAVVVSSSDKSSVPAASRKTAEVPAVSGT